MAVDVEKFGNKNYQNIPDGDPAKSKAGEPLSIVPDKATGSLTFIFANTDKADMEAFVDKFVKDNGLDISHKEFGRVIQLPKYTNSSIKVFVGESIEFVGLKESLDLMQANNKLTNSAHQLGVMLGIPMYVDPETGFSSEKVLTWENGDKIKVTALWADGAFYYSAVLGQIDPKTNEMAFISGEIANANSLESLIGMIDGFLKDKALTRGEAEVAATPEVTVPADTPVEGEPSEVAAADTSDDPADEIIDDYQEKYSEYQDLLLDPDHDHDRVQEISHDLVELEMRLREQGIRPYEVLK